MEPDKKSKRLGIVGGTFDPIHWGHLLTSETVREKAKLDKVLFIPAGIPPHKSEQQVSASLHRYRMVFLATENNPYFGVSDLEIKREGFSYTVDTIAELNHIYSGTASLFFLIGADALFQLENWKQPQKLLASCRLIVMTRPGYHKKKLLDLVDSYNKSRVIQGIDVVEVPCIGISSTMIRERVKLNLSIKYFVPAQVEDYILAHQLYK